VIVQDQHQTLRGGDRWSSLTWKNCMTLSLLYTEVQWNFNIHNNKTNRPYTALCYSNPKSCGFQLHENSHHQASRFKTIKKKYSCSYTCNSKNLVEISPLHEEFVIGTCTNILCNGEISTVSFYRCMYCYSYTNFFWYFWNLKTDGDGCLMQSKCSFLDYRNEVLCIDSASCWCALY